MALHSDGEKHGWGSASLPATVWGDPSHCVAMAARLARELERLGAIPSGWTVAAEEASYAPYSAGSGCIREPDGRSTSYSAQGRAVIRYPDHQVTLHIGAEDVWVQFERVTLEMRQNWMTGQDELLPASAPARRSMRLPRAALEDSAT